MINVFVDFICLLRALTSCLQTTYRSMFFVCGLFQIDN